MEPGLSAVSLNLRLAHTQLPGLSALVLIALYSFLLADLEIVEGLVQHATEWEREAYTCKVLSN